MEYVIGCDIGSQSVKAILLSVGGQLVGEASSGYSIDYPRPTWAEQPADYWITALCTSIRQLLQDTKAPPESIGAIGLAAQVDGVVAIDRKGKPLRPAIIWMDRRAVDQCRIAEQAGDPKRIFQISGLNLDASHVAPKIRWLRDQEPDVYSRSSHFLLAGSYVAYVLTGELAVDYSNASSSLLMDVRQREWSQELCELFDIPPSSLALIQPATTVLGHLRKEMAKQLGLSPKTLVVLGSGDEHAACLGAGVARTGIACDIAGTAEPVCAASKIPAFDPTGLLETHCHADPDLWLLENPGFVSGANYRWFRDQFAQAEVLEAKQSQQDVYELLNNLAASIPPGSDGLILLPCLMGAMTPTWNAFARGTYFGFTLAHTRAHFVRALLEASGYAVRDLTDQMRNLGLPLEQIRVVGGGARSKLWNQIKADVTGLPIAVPQAIETTGLGAGMLALVGSGVVPSLDQAADQVVHIKEILEPDPNAQQRYEDIYQLYRLTYNALLPVFEQAARISSG